MSEPSGTEMTDRAEPSVEAQPGEDNGPPTTSNDLQNVGIWYLIVTSILYVGQSFIEWRYARRAIRQAPRSFLQFLMVRRTPPIPDRMEHTA
jgi:hypothetical protein